jgi:NAD(P)-dependent dehydrogenase (short-subunit alcohol dehydrogenase family)
MNLSSDRTLRKPICLITGATEGVGKATATELVSKGFAVVLAARNAAKADAVKAEIRATTGGEVEIILADLTSLKAMYQLAESFKRRYPRLDVLINNAGIFMPKRVLTEDGFEACYQVNYLSHFLLTHLLLDELKKSDQGRIINLSSSVYTVGKFDAQNLQSEKRFSVMGAYAASKLFMLLFSIELAERLKGTSITVNAVHPGIARTQMMLRAPGMFKVVSYLALPFSVSPEKGAATSVYLASSQDIRRISGAYFTNCQEKKVRTKFDTKGYKDLLWNISAESLRRAGLVHDSQAY